MNRMPYFPFYPGDWIKGTRGLSDQEKGVWIDLLSYMWEAPERGKIISNWPGIARMVGLEWSKCEDVIQGLADKNVLNLTHANGIITLTSRRMQREEKQRESNRLRQKRFYILKPNANLTDNTQKSEVRSHIPSFKNRVSLRFKPPLKEGIEEHTKFATGAVAAHEHPNLYQEKKGRISIERQPVRDEGKERCVLLMKLWNERAHANLARVQYLPKRRERFIKARLETNPDMDFWGKLIEKINASPFLTGRETKWRCTFDWILNPENLAKILEDSYDDRERPRKR